VPGAIGTLVSRGLASLHELDTVYGTADLYDMIEIIAVDAHNQRLANKQRD
jgi:4-diphosphocytidyl-2C-methyl-D-erythritol kinase